MRGRFIIDMHPKSDSVTVMLADNYTTEDIVDQALIGDLVICHLDNEGNVLEVEILLPVERRTSHEPGFNVIEGEE